MKKILILILSVIVLSSCSNYSKYKKNSIRHHRNVLAQAFKTGDRITAINSIQNILIYDTANYELLDTLANLYIQLDDLRSAFYMGSKMIVLKEDDMHAWEIYGTMASRLNYSAEALKAFTKLYEKKKNTAYLYEIGVQNVNSGNIDAGITVIQSLLTMPQSITDIYIMRSGPNQYRNVPVISMAHYFLGSYAELKNENTVAAGHYANALKFAPDFDLAQLKLNKIRK